MISRSAFYNDSDTKNSDSSLCCTLYPVDSENVIQDIHYTKTNGSIHENINKRKWKGSVADTPTLPPLYEQNSMWSQYQSLHEKSSNTQYKTETFPFFDDTASLLSIPSIPCIPDKREKKIKTNRYHTIDPYSYIRSKRQRQKAAIQRYRSYQRKLENDKKIEMEDKYYRDSAILHRKRTSLQLSTTATTSECEVVTVCNTSNDKKGSLNIISKAWNEEIILPSFDEYPLSLSSKPIGTTNSTITNGNYTRNTSHNPFVTDTIHKKKKK